MTQHRRILVADKLSEEGIALLRQTPSFTVDVKVGLSEPELMATIGDYDAILVRSGAKVTAKVIDKGTRLKFIGRAGIGVDNIDMDAAKRAGIEVQNTPFGNSVSTAEHTIAMLMALARHIPEAHGSLRAGKWDKSKFNGVELDGKILGVIGLGHVGKVVARIAGGLNMSVLASDPFVTEEDAKHARVELVNLENLFSKVDFVTIHTPLTNTTRNLLGADAFAKMKKGVRIINVARGGLVDEAALFHALEDGTVAGAALDVFEQEPPSAGNPLLSHPRVVMTPHLGASTKEAQERVAMQIAEQARDFLFPLWKRG